MLAVGTVINNLIDVSCYFYAPLIPHALLSSFFLTSLVLNPLLLIAALVHVNPSNTLDALTNVIPILFSFFALVFSTIEPSVSGDTFIGKFVLRNTLVLSLSLLFSSSFFHHQPKQTSQCRLCNSDNLPHTASFQISASNTVCPFSLESILMRYFEISLIVILLSFSSGRMYQELSLWNFPQRFFFLVPLILPNQLPVKSVLRENQGAWLSVEPKFLQYLKLISCIYLLFLISRLGFK
ncbi:hypothetical protein GEMRC1_002566 [Eukaryota sp. GEM-RC1]